MKHLLSFKFLLLCLASPLLGLQSLMASDDGHVYVYRNGSLDFIALKDSVDSVALESDKTMLTIYSKAHAKLYTAPRSEIDSLTFSYAAPKADLLDVVFHSDGTAEDVSPMGMTVEAVVPDGQYVNTYKSAVYDRYVARFDEFLGQKPSTYYKINYEDNSDFLSRLADGHTIETLVMASYADSIIQSESKPFCSTQGGGTGFTTLFEDTLGRRKAFTFIPNVSTTGSGNYRETMSNLPIVSGKYYHLVGVWDKEAGMAYLYINGQLCARQSAPGNLVFPASGSRWFCIGGDPGGSSAEMGWAGDVVLARVYDKPLSAGDVKAVWQSVKELQDQSSPLVEDVDYLSGMPVKEGGTSDIEGRGYRTGDRVALIGIDMSKSYLVRLKVNAAGDTATFAIPSGFASGSYRLALRRGGQAQDLGICRYDVVKTMPKAPVVCFHRGFWDTPGSAQNSRASLRRAIARRGFSSEIDVWLTTDDSLMVNHDGRLNGVTIQTSSYDQVKGLKLNNGEYIPMLRDMLEILKTSDHTQLVVEIKTHSSTARTVEAANKAQALIAQMGLSKMVQYCSFNLAACRALKAGDSTAMVEYINGDKTPQELHDMGLEMDYGYWVYRSHPTWISEAHNLGLKVVAWTMNSRALIIEMAKANADILASDNPVETMKVCDYFRRHQDD